MSVNCRNDPSIEKMEKDLAAAGWVKNFAEVWVTPWGTGYRGPHKAWHIWHGGVEEWQAVLAAKD